MVLLTDFREYCAKERVLVYDVHGDVLCCCPAVLPTCPKDVLSEMKKICEIRKSEGHTKPFFLFPGDKYYPEELLEKE